MMSASPTTTGTLTAAAINSTNITATTASGYGLIVTTAANAFSGINIARTVNTASSWDIYSPSGSTDLRLFANGADSFTITNAGAVTIPGTLGVTGAAAFGGAVSTVAQTKLTGSWTGSGDAYGLEINHALTATSTNNILGVYVHQTVATASVNHVYIDGMAIDPPTISGTGTVTNANTLRIGGAPTISGGGTITNAKALWVTSGATQLDGTLAVGTATQSSAIEGQIQGSDTNHSAIFAKNNFAGSAGMATFHSSLGNGTNSVANTNCYHLIAVSQGSATYYLYGNGTTSFTSDERLKKNIETTRNGYVDDLCKLRVVKYQWKSEPDEGGKELGLIAQEVEKVFPGLVQDAAEEMNGFTPKVLKASVLPFMLLKAIQEQQIIITALTNRITALEAAR